MKQQYEYDEQGRLLREDYIYEKQKLQYAYCYAYDENGKVTQKQKLNPEGEISEASYYTLYEHDQDGMLQSENSYEGIGDTKLTNMTKYIYENGMLVRMEWYDCLGDTYTEKLRSIHTYDDQKRVSKIEDYCKENFEGYTVYTYDFDETWLKEVK